MRDKALELIAQALNNLVDEHNKLVKDTADHIKLMHAAIIESFDRIKRLESAVGDIYLTGKNESDDVAVQQKDV